MELKTIDQNGALVVLTRDELLTIGQALNEVCHGLDIPEFATRMGVEREVAIDLLHRIHAIRDMVPKPT